MKLAQSNTKSLKWLIYQTILGFIFLFFFFNESGYKEPIPTYKLFYQCVFFVCYFVSILISYKIQNYKQLLALIFFYSLVLSILLRIVFWEYFNLPFGDAVDSYKYDKLAVSSLGKGYGSLIKGVLNDFDIDDIGYSSIVWIAYSVSDIGFGQGIGQTLMLILNAIVITISSRYIYKTCIVLHVEKRISLIATSIYGFFPFLFITASVGLKENFFCLIVCYFFYCIYRYKLTNSYRYLFLTIIMVGVAYLFRFAVSLILLCVLCLGIINTHKNRKSLVVIGSIGFCLFPIFGIMIVEAFTGISFDLVLAVAESRNQRMESSVSGPLIQIIGALFGPFPNFSRTVQYGILHSAGLLLKSALSFIVLKQIWTTIYKLQWKYYVLIFYYLAGMFMLILSGVSLDMRFAVTFFPTFIILLAIALQEKMNWLLINFGQLAIYIIIIFYNFR